MRARTQEVRNRTANTAPSPVASIGRCLSGQIEISWRTGYVEKKLESLQKGITTLLEASHRHLLVTPPSHFTPQKVEGFVVGLTGNGRESMAEILDRAEILSREILLILFINNNSKLA